MTPGWTVIFLFPHSDDFQSTHTNCKPSRHCAFYFRYTAITHFWLDRNSEIHCMKANVHDRVSRLWYSYTIDQIPRLCDEEFHHRPLFLPHELAHTSLTKTSGRTFTGSYANFPTLSLYLLTLNGVYILASIKKWIHQIGKAIQVLYFRKKNSAILMLQQRWDLVE